MRQEDTDLVDQEDLEDMDPEERKALEAALESANGRLERGDRRDYYTGDELIRELRQR